MSMQFDGDPALTSLDTLLQEVAIYVYDDVVRFTLWLVAPMVFLDLDKGQAILDEDSQLETSHAKLISARPL